MGGEPVAEVAGRLFHTYPTRRLPGQVGKTLSNQAGQVRVLADVKPYHPTRTAPSATGPGIGAGVCINGCGDQSGEHALAEPWTTNKRDQRCGPFAQRVQCGRSQMRAAHRAVGWRRRPRAPSYPGKRQLTCGRESERGGDGLNVSLTIDGRRHEPFHRQDRDCRAALPGVVLDDYPQCDALAERQRTR